MKKAEDNRFFAFAGAGYILGGMIMILTGIAVYWGTEEIDLAISASVPIGITMGILFEQRYRQSAVPMSAGAKKVLWGLLIAGLAAFIGLLILTQLI
ncbi:MAG TPA: hypothetical protein PKE06_02075 [Flavilitoribacter sp.]|nr:hypothetical protein [Flavilitoribacter sp.]HMQ88673.1 hypothetical protein [Flavilitoribacter sp.]